MHFEIEKSQTSEKTQETDFLNEVYVKCLLVIQTLIVGLQ